MIKNEINRLRIFDFYAQIDQQQSYLNDVEFWLVQDEGDTTWKVLTCMDGTPVGMRPQYSQIASLCSSRAIDTEDGALLVNGKAIKAEQYLPLWRKGPKVKASDFGRGGNQLLVTVCRPASAMRAELAGAHSVPATKERQQALLQHPGLSDNDLVMEWELDVLTPVGMQAYDTLRNVYLSADAYVGFDRRDHWRVHCKPVTVEVTAIQGTENLQPQSANEWQLSFSL